jgi:hypothetical protein
VFIVKLLLTADVWNGVSLYTVSNFFMFTYLKSRFETVRELCEANGNAIKKIGFYFDKNYGTYCTNTRHAVAQFVESLS